MSRILGALVLALAFIVPMSYCSKAEAESQLELSFAMNVYQIEVSEDETNNGGPPQPISLIQIRYQSDMDACGGDCFFFAGWTHLSSIPTKESDCECEDIDIIGMGIGYRFTF